MCTGNVPETTTRDTRTLGPLLDCLSASTRGNTDRSVPADMGAFVSNTDQACAVVSRRGADSTYCHAAVPPCQPAPQACRSDSRRQQPPAIRQQFALWPHNVPHTLFSCSDRLTRTATRTVDEERSSTRRPFSSPFASTAARFVFDVGRFREAAARILHDGTVWAQYDRG